MACVQSTALCADNGTDPVVTKCSQRPMHGLKCTQHTPHTCLHHGGANRLPLPEQLVRVSHKGVAELRQAGTSREAPKVSAWKAGREVGR